jgi:vancomycin permeability regulator SanA
MRIPFFRRDVSICCFVVGLFFAALLALPVGSAGLYLARAPLLRAFARWWVVDEAPVKADAIVVLSGDSIDATRVRRAVQLYKQGWARHIILSGPLMRPHFSEGIFMIQDARSFGAPEGALQVVESQADSTLAEEEVILDYAARHNFPSLLVVTSDSHTRRAYAVYSAAAKKRNLKVRVISAPHLLIGKRWWASREALKGMFFELIKYPETWWEIRHPNPAGSAPED